MCNHLFLMILSFSGAKRMLFVEILYSTPVNLNLNDCVIQPHVTMN